ncbi:MAG: hypothetical protein HDT26_12835 [Subdoligranulum sp.]|nr:hypothetical protein [Subdoligranulum sp.]
MEQKVQALAKSAVTLQIGPASSGDRAALHALAESLCLGYEEDETGRIRIGPASPGDQCVVLTKAAALGLAYGVYKPGTDADTDEVTKLAAELQEMTRQRAEWETKANVYMQKINAAKAALEG